MPTPEYCPNCGDAVPPRARACPTCGSDETTGWSEDAVAQGLNLPDDKFDYQEFVREEFGAGEKEKAGRPPLPWYWWVTAVVVLIGIVFGLRLGCQ